MALSSYSELKSSVADWLNRSDLTSQIPDFITLGEAHANRKLRVLQMETMSEGTSDEQEVDVPADWLETRTFRLLDPTTSSPLLTFVGEQEWDELEIKGLTGTTRYYTIINGVFQVLPAPSDEVNYRLRYYAKIPALSDDNPSNWLLDKSPDLYLYNSLLAAEAFLKDDERLPIWKSIRDEIINDMNLESERAKRPATAMAARRQTYG